MNLEGTYNYEGGTTGKKLVNKINELVSRLSNIGKEKLSDVFGIDSSGKITDKSFIYKALIEEF